MNKIYTRIFSKTNWSEYKSIRLEALREESDCFCPSHNESEFTDDEWIDRIAKRNGVFFGLYINNELGGLAGIVYEDNDPTSSNTYFIEGYIRKIFRGNGYSALLYQDRINWAKKQGNIKKILLIHKKENKQCKRVHKKFSFSFLGETGDLKNQIYELNI